MRDCEVSCATVSADWSTYSTAVHVGRREGVGWWPNAIDRRVASERPEQDDDGHWIKAIRTPPPNKRGSAGSRGGGKCVCQQTAAVAARETLALLPPSSSSSKWPGASISIHGQRERSSERWLLLFYFYFSGWRFFFGWDSFWLLGRRSIEIDLRAIPSREWSPHQFDRTHGRSPSVGF